MHTIAVIALSTLPVFGAVAVAQQPTTQSSNPKATNANVVLPSGVFQQLEKQRSALRAFYLESTETCAGTLANWDYGVRMTSSAYFGGGCFYQHETYDPDHKIYESEVAFDGQTIWRRDTSGIIRKCASLDAPALWPARSLRCPYLEAAGIWAPAYVSELGHFTALESSALHDGAEGKLTKVERVGQDVRLTFHISDEMANEQKAALDPPRADMKPTRTACFLLDAKYGYAVAESENWNVLGERVSHTRCQDWKFYESVGIWLPGRCVTACFARPRLFISEESARPIHTVTCELKHVEFGKKDLPFRFGGAHTESHVFDRRAGTASPSTRPSNAGYEKIDIATVERIKAEVLQHSKVMDTASWLTDVYAPRLTGSPQTEAAGKWAVERLRSWGIDTARSEPWGSFRGWTSEQFAFCAVAPQPFVIQAVPAVWSPSTNGRVTGPAIRFDVHSFADMQRHSGKLKDAFLLLDPPQPTPAHFRPQATRLSEARLAALAAPPPPPHLGSDEVEELRFADKILDDAKLRHWLVKEGVAALLVTAQGDGGTIFMWGHGGSTNEADPLPIVKVSAESYGRLARILEKNIAVTLELETRNKFYDNARVSNIIAEIPGTDPKLKHEVVMFGAHLDSWTYATGATDNAAGAAMLMETMRILKALDLKPRRTIRIALWTGEEQGALGSEAYATQHERLRDGKASTLPSEQGRLSAYFNLDGGTGKIRGVFNPSDRAADAVLDAWMSPFREMGTTTVSPWDIGGGDDISFRKAHVPSFNFMQDPIEYESRTHHSSADVYERLQAEDLQYNTAVLVAFAWQAAQRDALFPR
jgi:hypothetical protein